VPEEVVRVEPHGTWPLAGPADADLTRQAVLSTSRSRFLYRGVKRLVDIVVSMAAILFCLPFWAIIAILIKRDSEGPILFKQKRPGLNGKDFTLLKFRTMVQDAESKLPEVMHLNQENDGSLIRIKNDPRVTPLGKFLRTSSLDETPQFINVLLGDMSLVGPRPISRPITDKRNPIRLRVTPGLTGLWQISGRKDTGCAFMIGKDLEYVCKRSLLYDLWIILQTVGVVLRGIGAR